MEIWYFETSAVNSLMENKNLGTLATKQLQLNKGRDWRISPVTIWEILMTSDDDRRDEIVDFCQHLFSRELLPSPGELIIPWIEQGMPRAEKHRELISKSHLAVTWREMVDDRNRHFIYDKDELKQRMKLVQSLGKDLYKILQNEDVILSSSNTIGSHDATISSLVEEIPFIKQGEPTNEEQKRAYKLSLFYIMFLLCAEADLDNSIIGDYWKKLGINGTLERIRYVVKELPMLVHRGPFITMAYMTLAQAEKEFSRGLWYDCLHSLYLPYIDHIFTSDGHFRGLKGLLPEPLISKKIILMDDIEWESQNMNAFGVRDI